MIKTYILQFISKNGNGWAIINAHSPNQAEAVFYTQTRFESAKVVSIKESRYYGDEMQLVYEGSVTTQVTENLYTLAVKNGYKGTLEEFIANQRGPKGDKGDPGEDGVGISSITKVSTQGLVDTYTITYTDGTSTTFQVTNGAKGDTGATGATGANGAAGRGISSIVKTGTSGLVDTYTITYTDGTTSTYQVTNGEDGQDAEEDLMITATRIGGTDNYYSMSYTWQELKTRVINGHDNMHALLILDNFGALKMPYYRSDSDAFLYFAADVQEGENVTHYELIYGDEDYAILTAAPLTQPLVEVSGTTPTQTLAPNTFYKFIGLPTSLTLTIGTPIDGITNIYAFSFVAGAANPTISLPASVTIDGTPSIAAGDYVEFNIMNNVALFKVVTI